MQHRREARAAEGGEPGAGRRVAPAGTEREAAPGDEVREQLRPSALGEDGDGDGRVKASPLARKLAEESGVELRDVSGTGPGGRITKRDIEAASQGGAPAQGGAAAAERAPARPAAAGAASEEVPVSQMRKAIAKRLAQSIGPIPTFYLTIECDMTRMVELRERVNQLLEKDRQKVSLNDFIIKAAAAALARHPEVNAAWGEHVIVRHHQVHIGVAVAVEDGLITPVIRDADRKRVRDIGAEVKELAARAREKKLKPEEYTGATFSISNLGMFGVVEFTAIINPPEAAILAVGAVEEKAVVENGELVARPRMRLTMSCDHRVVDGATGARFLQTLRELLEDPMTMIA
ncbi:MAG TPA: dihydrolipoamide acetyltransferase family protein [Longimicrobiales bacterium]|nr:dihydrolipoamide acetyltransferase family protein [Longimicrobiales bacterium]